MLIETYETPQNLLEPVKNHLGLPQLWVHLNQLGASQVPTYRIDLRRSLIGFLTEKIRSRQLGPFTDLAKAMSELMTLSDLNKIPQVSYAKISISHCPEFGGFAVHPGHAPIGFDIEVSSRVTPEVAQRISIADEFAQAPDAASLWVAKESSFKCLGPELQPKTMSQIRINSWTTINDRVSGFCFEFLNPSTHQTHFGRGCVVSRERLKLGFSVQIS